jgi:hypothetical protein
MGACDDLCAGFFLHTDQAIPGQLHVYVLNALAIAGWTLSHAPQLPALLRSEVGQAISFSVQNLLL